MNNIHPTAIIDSKANIAENVLIGAYSIIGANVTIETGTIVKSHVVIEGRTIIGKNNIIFPFASIGLEPQDLKFKGEDSSLVIGDNNQIREHCTIHRGTKDGAMTTKIGNNCLFMVGSHIAHDCIIGNEVILANNATLAGHVEVDDQAIIGGLSAVRQFVRIGKGAMVGGMSGVESDVIPFGTVFGERASLNGLNIIGMKRKSISREEIHQTRHFFEELFHNDKENFLAKIELANNNYSGYVVKEIINFIKSQQSSLAFCKPKK
jgi:UDP-N-acetylglucosamine acyltransferase